MMGTSRGEEVVTKDAGQKPIAKVLVHVYDGDIPLASGYSFYVKSRHLLLYCVFVLLRVSIFHTLFQVKSSTSARLEMSKKWSIGPWRSP